MARASANRDSINVHCAVEPDAYASSTGQRETLSSPTDSISVHCRVFQDTDQNGVWDEGETFLSGVQLTNGRQVFTTDQDGIADFAVDRQEYRFATMTIPAGYWPTNKWFHWMPVGHAGPDTVNFGLRVCPESAPDVASIRWVHIADTQTQNPAEPYRMDLDLQQINALSDPPLFLANTGDLVEVGPDTTHWNHYVEQAAVSNYEIFPIVGNHDIVQTGNPVGNFERWAGPPYFSWNAGNWHFISYNGDKNLANPGTPYQDEWLTADLAARAPGVHTVILQHYMMQETDPAKVNAWVAAGITACFSGHWHSHQFGNHPGFTDYNISWTRNGSVDRTPRVFGIVTCDADGHIAYEQRRIRVNHRANVVWPEPFHDVPREAVEVLVNAYDSSSPVRELSVTIGGAGGTIGPFPMSREGLSLWRVLMDASELPGHTYALLVNGSFADGTPISLSQQVLLDDIIPITRSPVTDWPMFRRCSAGSSYVSFPVTPPLDFAWATEVPGMVALSSPVVADGRVFLGCRAERDVAESGVLSCDAVTGQVNWFKHLPTGVALAPAVADNIVIASTMSDSTYGLAATTGDRVWAISQIEPRYTMTAPIFEGPVAWVGTEPRPRQVLWASGANQWFSANIGNPWYPLMYSAPAIGPDYIYFGFFGWDDPTTGGFKIVSRLNGSLVHGEGGAWRSPLFTPDGTVYTVGALDRNNEFLSARDNVGNVLWTATKNLGSGVGAPAIGHGILVVPGKNGNIEAFRATDGQNLWTKTVGQQLYDMEEGWGIVRATNSTPAIADTVVFVGSNDGRLYALDLYTGTEIWHWDAGVPISSSPAISGNMVFIATEDEHLYAFVAPTGSGGGTGVGEGVPHGSFEFQAPRPNPGDGPTHFAWSMPNRAHVALRLYDVRGRLLRSLLDQPMDAGAHSIEWDGNDARGTRVMSGVYFVQLKAGRDTAVRKLVRLGR